MSSFATDFTFPEIAPRTLCTTISMDSIILITSTFSINQRTNNTITKIYSLLIVSSSLLLQTDVLLIVSLSKIRLFYVYCQSNWFTIIFIFHPYHAIAHFVTLYNLPPKHFAIYMLRNNTQSSPHSSIKILVSCHWIGRNLDTFHTAENIYIYKMVTIETWWWNDDSFYEFVSQHHNNMATTWYRVK